MRNRASTSTVVQGGVIARKQGDNQREMNNMQYSRVTKIQFLKFGGEDVRGWLFKCEQFFKVDEITADQKSKHVKYVQDYFDEYDKLLCRVELRNDNEEIVWEVERENVDCELSKALNVVQEEDNVLHISLNALIGRNPFQTMWVIGYVGKQGIHILIYRC
ncbi:hypothetical protein Tco_0516729 [Tanacetum coccineum]